MVHPKNKIKVVVSLQDKISYLVQYKMDQVLVASPIFLQLTTGKTLGANFRVKASKRQTKQFFSLYKWA